MNVPYPATPVTIPSALSTARAFRTVGTDTSYWPAMARIEGSRVPGASSPLTTWPRMMAASWRYGGTGRSRMTTRQLCPPYLAVTSSSVSLRVLL